jgi:hypothetical protein
MEQLCQNDSTLKLDKNLYTWLTQNRSRLNLLDKTI